jgi:hypothetical protein
MGAVLGLAGLLLITGCANYRLGTGPEVPYRTLYIAPVGNEALVPQAVALVTREVRQAFIRDGRIQIVGSADEAEAVLTITLVDYGRAVATARADDTGLARKFDLTLTARLNLVDRTGDAGIADRTVFATRQAFTDGDGFRIDDRPAPGGQLSAEFQTLPLLAQQLAERVLHTVLDRW